MKGQSLEVRFENLVTPEPTTGCWLWAGATRSNGYGIIWLDGKEVYAHRVAFALFVGDPDGWCVLHRCGNRPCVNPSHLFLGSNADNVRDMVSKGRQCASDEAFGVKLTWEKVREIRASHNKQSEISVEFGISRAQVSRIRSGKRWKERD